MPNPTRDPKVAFHVATTRDVGHRIAQLLAMSELRSPFWLRETMLWMQLLPNRIMRIVLRVAPDDLNRVLSLDNFVHLYKYEHEGRKPLKIAGIPSYLFAEDWPGGAPRTNMSMAKSLAELLVLLIKEINSNWDRKHWDEVFCNTISCADYHNKPPTLTDGQCESLMEMADAWRDHILSVWEQPGMPAFACLSRQPSLTEEVLDEEALEEPDTTYIKFKPSDFPKLGESPSPDTFRFKPVTPVDKDEAGRLWKVAWLDQRPQARMWLGCGASPQSMAGGK